MADENEVVVTDAAADTSVDTPVVETPVVETPATDTGPKSVAEAFDAGLEAVPARTKQEADKAAGKVEGAEGEGGGKDEEKDKAAKDAEAAKAEADKQADKKEPDHINDPVPKEFGERAQERIRSLVGFVKERDEALTVQGNLIGAIQKTGTTAEEFATTIQFLEAIHSDKPEMLEKALQICQQNMESIALRLGRDVPGVDFLAQHQDLKDAVRYGQITQAHANEIARGRTAAARTQKFNEQRETAAQTEAAQKAEKDAAITSLNELGAVLHKTDPDYQRKFDLLTPTLKAAFANIRPSQWRATFEAAYKALTLPAAAAPVPATNAEPPAGMVRDPKTGQFVKANKGQPIRPVQPAGGAGSGKAPNSALSALSSAIDNLRS